MIITQHLLALRSLLMSGASASDGKAQQTRSLNTLRDSQDATVSPAGPPVPEQPLPETIGGYRIVSKLGEGGMGVVYRAVDVRLQREVALKVMRAAVATQTGAKDRFLREARAMAALKDDHIVTVYQVGEDGDVPFLAMELLEGSSLHDRARRGDALTWESIARIGRDIARGLAVAHSRGLIHRDIKPGNIWLEGPRERVKILDFGLARPVTEDAHLTANGVLVGTLSYMAPEQARGEHLDGRTDLFSLGVLLYRLGTGRQPFQGKGTMEVLTALAVDEPEPASIARPDMPLRLAGLIHQLLAKDPSGRPASAEATSVELDGVLDEVRTVSRVGGATPAHDTPMVAANDVPPPRRRNRWRIAAGFLGFLAMVAGGVIIIVKSRDGKETRVEVPDASTVKVSPDGSMTVEPTKPTTPATDVKPPVPKNPVMVKAGEPFNTRTFVNRPPPLPGVRSWTIESVAHPDGADDPAYRSCAWSKNGKLIATGGSCDLSVRIWDDKAQLQKILLGHKLRVETVEFSPDSTLLASGSPDCVRLWDVANGACIKEFTTGGWRVAFSPDGKHLAIPFYLNFTVYNINNGEILVVNSKEEFSYPSWSPDGRHIAVRHGHKLTVFDSVSLKPEYDLPLAGKNGETTYYCVGDWSPDGKWIAGRCTDDVIRIWDVKNRTLSKSVEYVSDIDPWLISVKWSRDSRRLLVNRANAKSLYCIIDTIDGKVSHGPQIAEWITRAAWSPNEKEIVAIGNRLQILDANNGRVLRAAPEASEGFALGRFPWLIHLDNRPVLMEAYTAYDLDTGIKLRDLEDKKAHSDALIAQHGGSRIALVQSPTIEIPRFHCILIDLEKNGKENKILDPAVKGQFHLDWSPDGRWICTSHEDGLIRVWDAETVQVKRELNGHEGIVCQAFWSPDGKRIASLGTDKKIRIWDPFEGKCLQTIAELAGAWPRSEVEWTPKLTWGRVNQSILMAYHNTVAEYDLTAKKWGEEENPSHSLPLQYIYRSPDGMNHLIGDYLGNSVVRGTNSANQFSATSIGFAFRTIDWLPDGRRFFCRQWPAVGYDVKTKQRLGTFLIDARGDPYVISPDGHCRGNAEVEKHLVYVAQLEDGSNVTLSPAEFAKRFRWKNDPAKARFLKLDE